VNVDTYVTVTAFLCCEQETVVAIQKALCLQTYLYCTLMRRRMKWIKVCEVLGSAVSVCVCTTTFTDIRVLPCGYFT